MNKVANTEGWDSSLPTETASYVLIAAVGNGRFWDELQITARSGPILDALQTDKALICDPFDLRKYPDLQQMRDVLAKQEPSAIVVIPNVWTSGAGACDGRIPGSPHSAMQNWKSLVSMNHCSHMHSVCWSTAARRRRRPSRWCAWCRRAAGSNRRRA